jgi:large subunit ribosomal protein L49
MPKLHCWTSCIAGRKLPSEKNVRCIYPVQIASSSIYPDTNPTTGLDSELRAQNMSSLPPTQQSQLQPPAPTGPSLSANIQRSTSPFPFLISRTPSQGLPVYETAKNGGNKHITSIRKISGDIEELAAAVRDALRLPQYIVDVKGRKKETVAINWTTNQVVIRGWRGAEIKKWAELSGF